MITLFGYHIIRVPGTRWYKFLSKREFAPRIPSSPTVKKYYLKVDVEDISREVLSNRHSALRYSDDEYDQWVTDMLNYQVDEAFR